MREREKGDQDREREKKKESERDSASIENVDFTLTFLSRSFNCRLPWFDGMSPTRNLPHAMSREPYLSGLSMKEDGLQSSSMIGIVRCQDSVGSLHPRGHHCSHL